MELIIKLILSYLLGSISGSMLIGKLKGIDIREMGSGNAGSTNAFRIMGTTFAILVMLIDVVKGYISVKYIPLLNLGIMQSVHSPDIEILQVFCAAGAVLGHVYSLYYGFKGGKGAGTMVGVLAAIFPTSLFIGFSIWLLIFVFSGFVGLSTIIASITIPVSTTLFYAAGLYSPFGWFSVMIVFFIAYTHRSNIFRMIDGNENRFEKIMIFSRNKD